MYLQTCKTILIFSFIIISYNISAKELLLHVDSPDWREQVIYFLMTDRFFDGDKTNNDQGAGEYNPKLNSRYNGGDLKGINKKINYIKNLGATSVWITPPIANQWYNPWNDYTGYHGYWAENFMEVDKHVGTLDEYKHLSSTLHKNGMYLIQDIVVNHVGDFFKVDENGRKENLNSKPNIKPTQFPFNLTENEYGLDIFHQTPDISDYQNQEQILYNQMQGLDDINTEDGLVRDFLKYSFRYWIEEVGVDGYRIDTALYVENDFWNDFLHSDLQYSMGIIPFARKVGKNNFITFGEAWVKSIPYSDEGEIASKKVLGTKDKPGIQSILNFPLYESIKKVFSEAMPTNQLSYRLSVQKKHFKDNILFNFIDNHDVNRFMASANFESMRLALGFLFTIPGVPIIYYGTEQLFSDSRKAMFKGGYNNELDQFNQKSDSYSLIKKLSAIRKNNRSLTHGEFELLDDSNLSAGVFSYKMKYENQAIIVLINTSNDELIYNSKSIDIPVGTKLFKLFSTNNDNDLIINSNKSILKTLEAKHLSIWKVTEKTNVITDTFISTNMTQNDSFIYFKGTSTPNKLLNLVIDNKIDKKIEIKADDTGKWSIIVLKSNYDSGAHRFFVYQKETRSVSNVYEFTVPIKKYVLIKKVHDLKHDDHGPKGNYLYPTDSSYKGQMDLENASIYVSNDNIKLSIKMVNPITSSWNPANGFDHVSFSIFLDIGGAPKNNIMPFQNSNLSSGMKWNFMSLAGGWTNFLYNSLGATVDSFGESIGPAPIVTVNNDQKTIDFIYSRKIFGDFTPEKIKVYISTWDYCALENKYCEIQKTPEGFKFGGANSTNPPYIMDDLIL